MIYNIENINDFYTLSKNLQKSMMKKNSGFDIKLSLVQESLAQSDEREFTINSENKNNMINKDNII